MIERRRLVLRTIRTRFRAVWIAPVLAVIALSAWAFASPVGSSPDDDFHLVSIWCASPASAAYCQTTAVASERRVPVALVDSICYVRHPELNANCQDRVSFNTADTTTTARGNFNGGYPPVFYAAMGLLAGPNIELSVLAMRIVNAVLAVGLITAVFALLPRQRRPALGWAWIVSTVPLGLFIIPSVNPSSWTVVGAGTAWIAVLGFLESEGRRRVALGALATVATVMAAGSRSDGAAYAALGVLCAVGIAARRDRRFLWASTLPVALVLLCALSILTSSQTLSAVNGFGASGPVPGGGVPTVPADNPPVGGSSGGAAPNSAIGLLLFNLLNVPSLWAGVFGSWPLGWFDTALPPVVAFGALACYLGLAFLGFGNLDRRKAIALGVVGLVLIALPVYVLTRGGSAVGREVQPRYVLPLIVIFAGLLALSTTLRQPRISRGQTLLVVLTLAAAQAISLFLNTRRYVTGTDSRDYALTRGWWWELPFGPLAVVIVGALAYSGFVALLAFHIAPREPVTSRASRVG